MNILVVAALGAWGGGGSDSTNNPKTKLASLRGCNNDEVGCEPQKREQSYGKAQPVESERGKRWRIGECVTALTLIAFLGQHREKKAVHSGKTGEGDKSQNEKRY